MYQVLNSDFEIVYENGKPLQFQSLDEAIEYVAEEYDHDLYPMYVSAPNGFLAAMIDDD